LARVVPANCNHRDTGFGLGSACRIPRDWLAFRTMAMLLQSRLSGAIREELGGTYDISAIPAANKFPRPEFPLRIEWTCDPTRTEALMQRVFQEIAGFQAMRLSPGQMRLVGESLRREFEVSRQDNGYLLAELTRGFAKRRQRRPDGDRSPAGSDRRAHGGRYPTSGADVSRHAALIGSRNAAVLPLPVCAVAMTSRP
jgi:hypothetical protein